MTPLRVLVVENAGDHRLSDAISQSSSTELAGVADTGRQAISYTLRYTPDAIVMSSSVLGINAYDATREIMTATPTPIIVVVDETGAGADKIRTKAQEAGALATIPFPAQHADLIDAVRSMAAVGVVRRRPDRNTTMVTHPAGARSHARGGANVVAIGASTGGPAALRTIIAALPEDIGVPVLITQHISPGFAEGMVYWWNAAGPLPVKLAEAGEPVRNNHVYVAPDDFHLTIAPDFTVALSDAPAFGGHRPSVSTMFRSVAERFGAGALGVILTGMGRDGVDGLAQIHRAGGIVCAQDEASSAVFGMPKAAIDAGIVDFIAPLTLIPRRIADAVASS